jgi:Bacterial toxin 30
VGNHYLDAEGNRYTANSVKPSSPAFDPKAANDTHIPFPTDQPAPHVPHVRVFVPNPAGVLGPDGSGG